MVHYTSIFSILYDKNVVSKRHYFKLSDLLPECVDVDVLYRSPVMQSINVLHASFVVLWLSVAFSRCCVTPALAQYMRMQNKKVPMGSSRNSLLRITLSKVAIIYNRGELHTRQKLKSISGQKSSK